MNARETTSRGVGSARTSPPGRSLLLNDRREWRTVSLAAAVYAGVAGVAVNHAALGPWLSIMLLAWFGAWHLSLQHELLHGHPFRRQPLNDLLGLVPVTLWIPYLLFKDDHLEHHRSDLTVPGLDNESFYVSAARWERAGPVTRAVLWANRTLLFRILVWVVVSTVSYVAGKVLRAARGHRCTRLALLAHGVGVLGVLWLVVVVAGMPLWQYALGAVYGGRVLNAIRPFPEHRFQPGVEIRTAMVLAGPVMSLLMLNNNLHVAHHDEPWVPWYDVPDAARRLDAAERAAQAGLLYRGGYLEVFRRFAFRPVDPPVVPSPAAGDGPRASRDA